MSVSNDAHVTGVLRFSSSCFRFCHGAPPPNDESSPCMWDPLDLTSSFHLLHNYRLSCTMMRDESNLQYNTMHHNAIQYNIIQYKTIQYDAIHYLNVIVQVFARFGKISGRVWLSHCLYNNGVTKQALISSRIEQEPARLHVHHP